jgi:non-heme chloroperoxidase
MRTHTVIGGGGIRLHVDETGNPRGRPILFIHGFSQSRLAWRKQMDSDLADDFRLVAMDLRGHGLSEKPRDAYGDSKLWADDIQAVIETLGLDRPVLSGWSYGGLIICDYLRQQGEGRIGGINLVGAVSKLGTDPAFAVLAPRFQAIVPGFFSSDVEESVGSLAQLVRLCMHEEPSPEDFYCVLGYNVIVPPHVREGLLSRTLDNDDLLPSIRKPVLIMHGENDGVVLPAAAEQHGAVIAHARTSVYPNVGHALFWEDPERFNRELRAFAQAL